MKEPKTAAAKIRAYKKNNPRAKPSQIARATGATVSNVYATFAYDRGKKAGPKKAASKWKVLAVATSNKPINDLQPKADPVNHPAHYKVGGIETIDFIEAKKLNYNLGNVVKYLTRADHKGNRLQDLQKAQWYLEREIQSLT